MKIRRIAFWALAAIMLPPMFAIALIEWLSGKLGESLGAVLDWADAKSA